MADHAAERSQEQKPGVAESLRGHRVWLLSVVLFPLATGLASAFLPVPYGVCLFIHLFGLAPWWDYSRCQRPFTLWIVAVGIWLAAWVLMGMLGVLIFGSLWILSGGTRH
jgi:hypothetical protein